MKKTLIQQAEKESRKRVKDFVSSVNEIKDSEEVLSGWYFRDKLTPAKKRDIKNGKLSLTQIKHILKERFKLIAAKDLAKEIDLIESICDAPDINRIQVQIEWRKSATWGNNPNATCEVNGPDYYDSFNSGSIGGCGYCKKSTAFAEAINQSHSVRKLLLKNRNKIKDIYGHRRGKLEGGVGVECYPKIFEKCGYKMEYTANGKTFDVYTIVKK